MNVVKPPWDAPPISAIRTPATVVLNLQIAVGLLSCNPDKS